jgi:hypothetical protein
MMVKGDYKFIYTHGIIAQLYNLKNDPDELNNLIFDENYKKIYQDLYFQTLAEWRFQEYSPIKVTLKRKKMKWEKSDEFTDYAVYFSNTNDVTKAKLIATNISENSFEVKDNGYYWLIAKPKLSKTSKFYGEKIPVAVEVYSFILPVSDAVKYVR